MAARPFFVIAHRWAGLITALFIAVAALTGSIIAFEEEIDGWLNPRLFHVSVPVDAAGRARPMLHPLEIRERAERALPDYYVANIRFHREPGEAQELFLRPKPGTSADGNQAFLNPYTGELLGVRNNDASLVGFIYQVHYTLAIPGTFGRWLMGLMALVWTLDCFVGFVLTLPRARPFWTKWSIAWRIKKNAAPVRLNLDLHRAFGLWLWALLLIYAWSSVMLNLRQQVYRPVMASIFTFSENLRPPKRAAPVDNPTLDWRAAESTGKAAMQALAREKSFEIYYFDNLSYIRDGGFYAFSANTSRDIVRDRGQTSVFFDANTGELLGFRIQTGEASGDTISRWLQSLHMAQIWGRPYQIFVCLMGLVITMLSVTGVIIWWNKRSARQRAAAPSSRLVVVHGEHA